MKIVYMGTPDFAIPSLEALLTKHNVLGVVTAADKPAGRGHHLQSSPIKLFAQNHNIPVFQPKNLKSTQFYTRLKKLNADIFVVVAFRMLPEVIWSMPKYGTLNLHASLLPKYRGAAPIQRAIMNGENETGLTVFKLNHHIDTGDILIQSKMKIGPDETGGELHDRMMNKGGVLLLKSLDLIQQNELIYIPQNDSDKSDAPKLFREDCEIQWTRTVDEVYNHIRALIPYPCAWSSYKGQSFKICKCRKHSENSVDAAGTFVFKNKQMLVACLDGYIEILEIQPNGKRIMSASEFINGLKL